jgi:hypothetical protein
MVFMLSLQDMEGDNKVVNLIEDWVVFVEYTGDKLGFYIALKSINDLKRKHTQNHRRS